VDTNDHLLRDLQDRLDIRTVAGNGAHPNVLEMAGAANADMIVALTNSDEVNMVACQVAWTLFRTRTKIARIRSLAYTGHEALFFDTDSPPPDGAGFPVDVYISPRNWSPSTSSASSAIRCALQVLEFADGRVRLVGVKAVKGGPLVGQQLRSIASTCRTSTRAWSRSTARAAASRPRATRSSTTATRCSSSPRPRTCAR